MPMLYLSPSTQQYNLYVTDGKSEEYYMNLIADAMEPYLYASGISFKRNNPEGTASDAINDSNADTYGLHLALHSNASPDDEYGENRGMDIFYYPTSTKGKIAAELIADDMRMIYPDPNDIQIIPTTQLGELRRTKAPAVLVEYAYHDNVEDARWITDNIDKIARYTVMAVCMYFGIPFNMP